MFKKIIVLGLLAIIMVASIGCVDGNQWTILESSTCHSIVNSDIYSDNYGKSETAYQEAIVHFIMEDGNYSNDYAGAFVDENGITNICVVGKHEPVKSDYLVYKQVKHSYNFLNEIQEEVDIVWEEYSVWKTSICVTHNKVNICLEDESQIPLLVKYLKKKRVFKKDSLSFFMGEAEIYEDR